MESKIKRFIYKLFGWAALIPYSYPKPAKTIGSRNGATDLERHKRIMFGLTFGQLGYFFLFGGIGLLVFFKLPLITACLPCISSKSAIFPYL